MSSFPHNHRYPPAMASESGRSLQLSLHAHADPAHTIAARYGIRALSRAHWEIIETLRDYHARFGVPPSLAHVHHRLGKPAFWTHGLFGDALTAWRIAGLPDPGEEAKSYMEDM